MAPADEYDQLTAYGFMPNIIEYLRRIGAPVKQVIDVIDGERLLAVHSLTLLIHWMRLQKR